MLFIRQYFGQRQTTEHGQEASTHIRAFLAVLKTSLQIESTAKFSAVSLCKLLSKWTGVAALEAAMEAKGCSPSAMASSSTCRSHFCVSLACTSTNLLLSFIFWDFGWYRVFFCSSLRFANEIDPKNCFRKNKLWTVEMFPFLFPQRLVCSVKLLLFILSTQFDMVIMVSHWNKRWLLASCWVMNGASLKLGLLQGTKLRPFTEISWNSL